MADWSNKFNKSAENKSVSEIKNIRQERFNQRKLEQENKRNQIISKRDKTGNFQKPIQSDPNQNKIIPPFYDQIHVLMTKIPVTYNINSKKLSYNMEEFEHSDGYFEIPSAIAFCQEFFETKVKEWEKNIEKQFSNGFELEWDTFSPSVGNLRDPAYNKDNGEITGECYMSFWSGPAPTLDIHINLGLNFVQPLSYVWKNNLFQIKKDSY